MTKCDSRGAVLLETLVLGLLIAALAIQTLLGASRLQSAGEQAQETAQYAAVAAARYGNADDAIRAAREMAPDAVVHVTTSAGAITVVVALSVGLVTPSVRAFEATVRDRATVPISPYRSGNG